MSVEILLMSCMSVWRFRDELRVCSLAWHWIALHYIALAALGHTFQERATDKRGCYRRLYDYYGWAGMCVTGLAFSYRHGGDDNNGGV